jgi:hypothetical protein
MAHSQITWPQTTRLSIPKTAHRGEIIGKVGPSFTMNKTTRRPERNL